MRTYKYAHLLEYIPVRYSATSEQKAARQTVFDFKDGYCSESVKQKLAKMVKTIMRVDTSHDWRVCFIPASSSIRTIRRYSRIAPYIHQQTGCPCDISTISTINDTEPGHYGVKPSNPAANFKIKEDDVKGVNIILIDDVITRGNTFAQTANKLIANGANDIIGLFLAKTVHPQVACNYA